jgi:hypothetical protein
VNRRRAINYLRGHKVELVWTDPPIAGEQARILRDGVEVTDRRIVNLFEGRFIRDPDTATDYLALFAGDERISDWAEIPVI